MTNQVWINLPVKNLEKSLEFYKNIGFRATSHMNGQAGIQMGESPIQFMLFPESTFKGFTKNAILDYKKGTEVLFSIGADSRDEVDKMALLAKEAGGQLYEEPSEHDGWMYGCGMIDLDGHRWNVLYMDMEKHKKSK